MILPTQQRTNAAPDMSRQDNFLAALVCALTLGGLATSTLGQPPPPPNDYNVVHDFALTDLGGTVAPEVEWVHREYAFARTGPTRQKRDSGVQIDPVLAPGADEECQFAFVQQTVANACSGYTILNMAPDAVTGTHRSFGGAVANRDGYYSASARATSWGKIRARGQTMNRRGRVRWTSRWRSSAISAGGGFTRRLRNRDPIIGRRTDLDTMVTVEHVLLSIDATVEGGALDWEDDLLTNSADEMTFEFRIDSPWTVQQGLLQIEVEGGVVTQAVKTGFFSGLTLPTVGSSGDFTMALPCATEIDYDMGGSDTDNLQIDLEFDNGGDTEAADQGLYSNGQMVTAIGEGFDGARVSVIEAPSTTPGWSISRPTSHIADDFTVPPHRVWYLDMVAWPVYQLDSAPTDDITAAYVQLWNGPPGAGGAVIDGNLTVNRLIASDFNCTYRVDGGDLQNEQRAVKEILIDLSDMGSLDPGTYWIEIAATGAGGFGPPEAVPTVPRDVTDNARILNVGSGLWNPVIDPDTGSGVDYPFLLFGSSQSDVPTVSVWGLIVMTLLLLTAGALVLSQQCRRAAA